MEKFRNQGCKVSPYDVGSGGGLLKNDSRQSLSNVKRPYDLNTTSLSETAIRSKRMRLK